jgi:type VI secretion system protein ImpK
MSSDNPPGGGGGNRTIFRPSPLSGMRQGQPPAQPPQQGGGFPPPPPTPQGGNFAPVPTWGSSAQAPPPLPAAPPSFGQVAQPSSMQPVSPGYVQGGDAALPAGFVAPQPYQGAPMVQGRLSDEDIPLPSQPRETRSPLVMEAGPVLALAASVRSGRARIAMPNFHKEATDLVGAYDRAISGIYPEEVRMRALYALCATVDDIAQNLPNIGQDGAEWARRSLVITFFRENIGGDRFWQLVDDILSKPALNSELIELFADCLAAGFEGRFRIMADGRTRLQQIFNSIYGALEHPRSLSQVEISPRWRGAEAPLGKLGLWNKVALAIAAALAGLLLIYIVLRLLLMSAGGLAWDSVSSLTPKDPLRLSRAGAPPPAGASGPQASKLRKFLEPEIAQKLVVVEEDASTVRVRTTVGQLFQSGSDQLETGRQAIFERIGRAVEGEPGDVTIEGHADSDKISSLSFPDNAALSKARAQTVSGIIGGILSNPARIRVEGYGDSRPIGDNKTPEGKALNRRVEVIIPRRD